MNFIPMILLIVGALNLFFAAFHINIIHIIFGRLTTFIYIMIGISAFTIMFHRDTYLPFLGPMVAPCSVLENKVPSGATRDITVDTEPNVKILYWAAEASAEPSAYKIKSWKEAYTYQNAGVSTSNSYGVAILKIREPQSYTVPIATLMPHIHYRICNKNGWMGRINTAFIK